MKTFSLSANILIEYDDRRICLKKRLRDGKLFFQDDFGEPVVLSERDFYNAYEKKELAVCSEQPHLERVPEVRNAPPDLTCFPTTHSEEALRRRKYLDALLGPDSQVLPSRGVLAQRISEVARLINDVARPPSLATIYRWLKRYVRGKCVVELVPHHCQKGRSLAISGEIEEVLQKTIDEEYLKLERPAVSQLYQALRGRIKNINKERLPSNQLAIPSEMTVRRYIDRLDEYEIDKKRLGKYAADQKHRNSIGQLQVSTILDRWEIDHTLLDVLLVDPETGEVIGRPYITVILDRYSRMVMSFWVHITPPNTGSVLLTIERAIRPKHAWLERFPNVQNEWRSRGLPRYIVPDNAAEFHANNLIMAFDELGIEVLFPRSRGPQHKGGIERFFRTLAMDLIHRLPGTTFSNIQERGDYPSEKLACLTLPELEAAITKWIVDCYHQRPHRGLKGLTPAEVWKKGELKRSPRLPTDLDALESILAHRDNARLHHYGIEVDCQQYHSDELAELRLRVGQAASVDVRFRDDLGYVWVRDPIRNVFLQVPNKDKRMNGMSRDIYRAARKRIKEANGNPDNMDAVFEAYDQIMADVDLAKKSNKLRKRRAAAQAQLDKEGQSRTVVKSSSDQSEQAPQTFEFDSNTPVLPIRPMF